MISESAVKPIRVPLIPLLVYWIAMCFSFFSFFFFQLLLFCEYINDRIVITFCIAGACQVVYSAWVHIIISGLRIRNNLHA